MKITKRNIAKLLKKDLSYDVLEYIREEIEKQFYLTENKNTKAHLRKYGDALYFLQNNLKEDFEKISENYKKESNEIKRQSMLNLQKLRDLQEEDEKLKNRFRLITEKLDELKLIKELI